MAQIKHVGRNGDRKVLVLYREVPGDALELAAACLAVHRILQAAGTVEIAQRSSTARAEPDKAFFIAVTVAPWVATSSDTSPWPSTMSLAIRSCSRV